MVEDEIALIGGKKEEVIYMAFLQKKAKKVGLDLRKDQIFGYSPV